MILRVEEINKSVKMGANDFLEKFEGIEIEFQDKKNMVDKEYGYKIGELENECEASFKNVEKLKNEILKLKNSF